MVQNFILTSESVHFLPNNNCARILPCIFQKNDYLYVCGGILITPNKYESNFLISDNSFKNENIFVNTIKENSSSIIEKLNLKTLKWEFSNVEMPNNCFSSESLEINDRETLIFGGYYYDNQTKSNYFNKKIWLVETYSGKEEISEFLDLEKYFENEIFVIDIQICLSFSQNQIFIIISHEMKEKVGEIKINLMVLNIPNKKIFFQSNFNRVFEDSFGKNIYQPIFMKEINNKLKIFCKHIFVKTELKEFDFKYVSCSNHKNFVDINSVTTKQITSNKNLGSNPKIIPKYLKEKSTLLPIYLKVKNESMKEFTPYFTLVNKNNLDVFDISNNYLKSFGIPERILPYVQKSAIIFLSDDHLLFCGGYISNNMNGKYSKEILDKIFIFQLSVNKWISPYSLSLNKKKLDGDENIIFSNDSVMQLKYQSEKPKLIIFKNHCKFI